MAAEYKLTYTRISTRTLSRWKEVIIPYVYDELLNEKEAFDEDYIGIGVKDSDGPVGALAAHIEQLVGDVQILSIYVEPDKRRRGAGSGLIKRLFKLMANTFVWEKGEYGTDVYVKTMYALPAELCKNYEAFLKANRFTQFYIFEKARGRKPSLRGADAKLHLTDIGDE